VPAERLAAGSKFVNLVMVGALAAALGEPSVEAVGDAAVELLGRKVAAADIRDAVGEGFACLS
jgi:Pyruvate/2-oxoacid:ferredoxin oxidoreductase gamma subunit